MYITNRTTALGKWLYEVIFKADTPEGKYFDVALIISIILSVLVVMLDSVEEISSQHGNLLYALEWFFTLLFTVEYAFRLYCVQKPIRYAISFYGIVDFLAIIPTYLSLLFPGTQYLLTIRILRVLRIFRILKITHYISESEQLVRALQDSRRKITVFLFSIVALAVVFGAMMYLIEDEVGSGFTSIPKSVYWAIVTLTTVGYGDISPATPLGQCLASVIMIMGYSIIAIPTGIVTVAMRKVVKAGIEARVCPRCSTPGHEVDANFCKLCGKKL